MRILFWAIQPQSWTDGHGTQDFQLWLQETRARNLVTIDSTQDAMSLPGGSPDEKCVVAVDEVNTLVEDIRNTDTSRAAFGNLISVPRDMLQSRLFSFVAGTVAQPVIDAFKSCDTRVYTIYLCMLFKKLYGLIDLWRGKWQSFNYFAIDHAAVMNEVFAEGSNDSILLSQRSGRDYAGVSNIRINFLKKYPDVVETSSSISGDAQHQEPGLESKDSGHGWYHKLEAITTFQQSNLLDHGELLVIDATQFSDIYAVLAPLLSPVLTHRLDTNLADEDSLKEVLGPQLVELIKCQQRNGGCKGDQDFLNRIHLVEMSGEVGKDFIQQVDL
ncbi:MAG: hypothetical protein M1836_000469 [Candelina mexicana]|nr:MAG: hypothetical protein M1836_000469 [Candelina mexicana]